jgi:hypothetical protein
MRFYRHLVFRLYSFGDAKTHRREEPDGSFQTITDRILFREIRGLTPEPIMLGSRPKELPLDSPIFFSFGGRNAIAPSRKPAAQAKPLAGSTGQVSAARKWDLSLDRLDAEIRRRALYRVFMVTAPLFQSRRLTNKLVNKPTAFFRDAKSPITRYVGRKLLEPLNMQ